MIGVDTNVWVRYVTNDDPVQAALAVELLRGQEEIFVPKTVLLELEWVLRAVYAIPKENVLIAFRQILGLPNVQAECAMQVASAIELYERGFDFADALHLMSSENTSDFFTFDSRLVKLGSAHALSVRAL
ncbi:MAG: type II toxin-antitoxin system VapC family toxin [Nitrospirae bacterium]|nr:type II toxin-antitoxin system VapC family toxin [Nitrospirota bacterium]